MTSSVFLYSTMNLFIFPYFPIQLPMLKNSFPLCRLYFGLSLVFWFRLPWAMHLQTRLVAPLLAYPFERRIWEHGRETGNRVPGKRELNWIFGHIFCHFNVNELLTSFCSCRQLSCQVLQPDSISICIPISSGPSSSSGACFAYPSFSHISFGCLNAKYPGKPFSLVSICPSLSPALQPSLSPSQLVWPTVEAFCWYGTVFFPDSVVLFRSFGPHLLCETFRNVLVIKTWEYFHKYKHWFSQMGKHTAMTHHHSQSVRPILCFLFTTRLLKITNN